MDHSSLLFSFRPLRVFSSPVVIIDAPPSTTVSSLPFRFFARFAFLLSTHAFASAFFAASSLRFNVTFLTKNIVIGTQIPTQGAQNQKTSLMPRAMFTSPTPRQQIVYPLLRIHA